MRPDRSLTRRGFVLALGSVAFAGPAHANNDPETDSILRQLRAQGYRNISVSRTWLGRVRIMAHREDSSREIVYNPSTGALMRDYSTATKGGSTKDSRPLITDRSQGPAAGRGGPGANGGSSGAPGRGGSPGESSGKGRSGGGNGNSGGGRGGNSGRGNSGSSRGGNSAKGS